MIYISDHLNWQIKQYSIWSNINPVTAVYTNANKHFGSQSFGNFKQNLDPNYIVMMLMTSSSLKKRVIFHTFHTQYHKLIS